MATDADGGVTTTVYDVQGRKLSLTTPNGQTTSWTYDSYDRVLTETNALTQTKTFAYDSADRKTLVIMPDGNWKSEASRTRRVSCWRLSRIWVRMRRTNLRQLETRCRVATQRLTDHRRMFRGTRQNNFPTSEDCVHRAIP